MKRTTLLAALLVASITTPIFAQTLKVEQVPPTRKIEVTGFAELEVTPDELYFNISLREYFKDEKSQKDKVVITTLEKELVKAVTDAGLSKENLTVTGVGGYQKTWEKNKKPATFLESKQYQLKVNTIEKLDVVLSKVDSRGIEYANIGRVDHSQKEELKKQVKINALKAAKDKATYLLVAISEKLGPVIEIRELEDNLYYPQPMFKAANVRMMAAEAADAVQESDLSYQKIKISYRMQAVFDIR